MPSLRSDVSMPGFTAEASLYPTGGSHRTGPARAGAPAMQAVTPALSRFCAIMCAVCGAAGGVGPECWRCRNCALLGDY